MEPTHKSYGQQESGEGSNKRAPIWKTKYRSTKTKMKGWIRVGMLKKNRLHWK